MDIDANIDRLADLLAELIGKYANEIELENLLQDPQKISNR